MTLAQSLKLWLGGAPVNFTCAAAPSQEVTELARAMTRCREAVKIAFGERAASDPIIVAEFMRADASYQQALEVRAIREVLATGTGALTIGIERPS